MPVWFMNTFTPVPADLLTFWLASMITDFIWGEVYMSVLAVTQDICWQEDFLKLTEGVSQTMICLFALDFL